MSSAMRQKKPMKCLRLRIAASSQVSGALRGLVR